MATSSSSSSSSTNIIPSKPLSLPLKTRIAVAVLNVLTDLARRQDGTINRRLLSCLDISVKAKSAPIRGVRTADTTVDPDRNLWFRLFIPTDVADASRPLPLIVFFHGGGFAFLSPAVKNYDAVCRRFARKLSALVVSVDYRLAPEHRCPAPYVDGFDVLRFLDDNVDNMPDMAASVDLSACFLVGDSAGGNIVHHVARRWAASANDFKKLRLAGVVAIQPFFGGEERTGAETMLRDVPIVSLERTDWLWRAFLPEGADRDHEAANVFGARDAVELEDRFPPAMVVIGGWDPLKEWQRRYAEGLRRRGKEVRLVEYEDTVHAFYVFPELKEAGFLIEEIKEFIATQRKQS